MHRIIIVITLVLSPQMQIVCIKLRQKKYFPPVGASILILLLCYRTRNEYRIWLSVVDFIRVQLYNII